MTNYWIPEQSDLGQIFLEMSCIPGQLYDFKLTKKEILDSLDYLAKYAKEMADTIRKNPHYLDEYRGDGSDNGYYY